MQQPRQPLYVDDHDVVRFHPNKIVRYLLDHGSLTLNDLALIPFSDEDRRQFEQLIGRSVCGYTECPFVDDEEADEVHEAANLLLLRTPTPTKKTMHSFNTATTTFLHNGDFDGDVIIVQENDNGTTKQTRVPAKEVFSFVAEYVRRERISALEQCEDHELLGVPKR